jgi:pimeloyl-ACP methyl ester carboxylesterase
MSNRENIGRRGAMAAAVGAMALVAADTTGAKAQVPKIGLILVPGTFSDETQFKHQLANLADIADMKVSMRHMMHNTMEGMAQGILRDAPPKFAIFGLSLGGRAALEVARQAPDRVIGIGLISSTGKGGTSPARAAVAKMQAELGYAAMVDQMMPILMPPSNLANKPMFDEAKAMILRAGPEIADRQAAASDTARDQWDMLPTIKVPALLIGGRQDRIAPPADMEQTAKGFPNSRLVIIEDCGHLGTQEKPVEVTAAMREWLGVIAKAQR